MEKFNTAKSKKELGLEDNKSILINSLKAIEIDKFRSFGNRFIELAENITVFIGRNGTMKTSLMGLIAHPFGGESKDAFGKPLKTSLNNVFKFSDKYDKGPYKYNLFMQVIGKDEILKESVTIRLANDGSQRHRIVVSGHEQGDGNFTYNTSFLNLKRLLPLVDTKAKPDEDDSLKLSSEEQTIQKDFYEQILPSMEYGEFAAIHERNTKTTFAPTGRDSRYDFESISSGEDNLGSIFNRLIGFQRAFKKGQSHGNGIFCIDEFESSLHPVAQLRLFKYLFDWSRKYKVQIAITTHSLHLIQHIYLNHKKELNSDKITLNFVSCAKAGDDKNYPIIKNPDYQLAYKELTLEDPINIVAQQKINVFCEDDLAIHFVKRIVKKKSILDLVCFHSSLNKEARGSGTSYTSLASLCSNYPLLLDNAFAIFDADVSDEKLKKIGNKNTFLLLPDTDRLAIERRIVCYILELKNDDAFFVKFNNEKAWFLDKFKSAGIKSLSLDDVKNESVVNIKNCKQWADQDISSFKKYVTYYCDSLNERQDFINAFVERINLINQRRGLPLISGV